MTRGDSNSVRSTYCIHCVSPYTKYTYTGKEYAYRVVVRRVCLDCRAASNNMNRLIIRERRESNDIKRKKRALNWMRLLCMEEFLNTPTPALIGVIHIH